MWSKPVVEGSVRFVANQVAAVLRNRHFVGLAELNEAIFGEVAEINARPFQKREDSRQIVFVRDERPLLAPLPPIRFELADLRKAKVGPNYHISAGSEFLLRAVDADRAQLGRARHLAHDRGIRRRRTGRLPRPVDRCPWPVSDGGLAHARNPSPPTG